MLVIGCPFKDSLGFKFPEASRPPSSQSTQGQDASCCKCMIRLHGTSWVRSCHHVALPSSSAWLMARRPIRYSCLTSSDRFSALSMVLLHRPPKILGRWILIPAKALCSAFILFRLLSNSSASPPPSLHSGQCPGISFSFTGAGAIETLQGLRICPQVLYTMRLLQLGQSC